ncbi:conserved hypothetical protein [Xenorhabdus bovienii str. puntauvense]|uniref:DUF4435 domain-containing protein n=1 Tax=Xenorhabdus bovienii str. puntauvense TaxID=1398201 RepID=A0A077NE58_XENBV|nr:DUF4435 domain-containing protein [Xenorhabdus bovienii]CDG96507.1 conserved hypothetical protein [Xenorhabdus bovienii str. puntauvense]
MAEIMYSTGAENVLHKFHRVDYMVYVEGDDDKCFWEYLINYFVEIKYKIQAVGGSNNLKKYIETILNNESKNIVATDSDLNIFGNNIATHPRILRTYGYSIENTFISIEGIRESIGSLGKYSNEELNALLDINSWMDNFLTTICPLIKIDIYNHMNKCGLQIMGDKVEKFLIRSKNIEICPDKINNYMYEKLKLLNNYNEEEITSILDGKNTHCRYWLRGHFLFSAVANLIRVILSKDGKKISLSAEALYSQFIIFFKGHFNNNHEEYEYYEKIIQNIK